ncbi:hypothetical protein D3C76_1579360 [compost metagenome]
MGVTKNPDINLSDQVMPLVEIRRAKMAFMTITGDILDGAMVGNDHCFAVEVLRQLCG